MFCFMNVYVDLGLYLLNIVFLWKLIIEIRISFNSLKECTKSTCIPPWNADKQCYVLGDFSLNLFYYVSYSLKYCELLDCIYF